MTFPVWKYGCKYRCYSMKSPILYFKIQVCEKECLLLMDNFMIVIMTSYQKYILAKYATNRECVDNTHGTTSHTFQLTTLFTVNEFGSSCNLRKQQK